MFWDHLNKEHKNEVERIKALPMRSLPTMVNHRWFQVHPAAYNHEGESCAFYECQRVEYHVVDPDELIVYRSNWLPEAIQKAEDLNWEMINDVTDEAKQSKGQRRNKESTLQYATFAGIGGGGAGDVGGGT